MIVLCSMVLAAIWCEHLLLLGPALTPQVTSLPLGPSELLITLGFMGLMVMALRFLMRAFPELIPVKRGEVV